MTFACLDAYRVAFAVGFEIEKLRASITVEDSGNHLAVIARLEKIEALADAAMIEDAASITVSLEDFCLFSSSYDDGIKKYALLKRGTRQPVMTLALPWYRRWLKITA